jgi:hypothetical protein
MQTCACAQFDRFVRHVRKIAKRTISFVMSARPSARMEKFGFRWTHFHEILHLSMCIFECVDVCRLEQVTLHACFNLRVCAREVV